MWQYISVIRFFLLLTDIPLCGCIKIAVHWSVDGHLCPLWGHEHSNTSCTWTLLGNNVQWKLSLVCELRTLVFVLRDNQVALLGIYPEKRITENDTCTSVFIAALFTIPRTWKQPRCPPADEWIKKLWCMCVCVCVYIHTLEYYSVIKRNAFESILMKWMNILATWCKELTHLKRPYAEKDWR